MFTILHRIYVVCGAILVVASLSWLVMRTDAVDFARDWSAVLYNTSEVAVKPVGELTGQVIKVVDGGSLMVRASDRQLYSIGLLGIEAPPFKPNSADGELAKKAMKKLSGLVLSNHVQVTLTLLDPQRRGVGVIHLGETNVNAAMVETGSVGFQRKFIKGLPLLDQYSLVRADRRAKEQKLSSLN